MNNTFGNALVETLRSLLKTNIVCFTYKKVDGTMRVARGTRNLSVASALGYSVPTPKNGEQPYSYYDLDCEGWRSYRPENLISIDGVIARTDTIFAKTPTIPNEIPVKNEPTEVEIPVHIHTADGTNKTIGTAKVLGKPIDMGELPIGNGKTAPVKMQPIDLGDLGKIITGLDKGTPVGGKTGGTITSPQGEYTSIDQFARLVAKYVVDELVSRIK